MFKAILVVSSLLLSGCMTAPQHRAQVADESRVVALTRTAGNWPSRLGPDSVGTLRPVSVFISCCLY